MYVNTVKVWLLQLPTCRVSSLLLATAWCKEPCVARYRHEHLSVIDAHTAWCKEFMRKYTPGRLVTVAIIRYDYNILIIL